MGFASFILFFALKCVPFVFIEAKSINGLGHDTQETPTEKIEKGNFKPNLPLDSIPDLPGPVFYRILRNRLEEEQENQLYSTKSDDYIILDSFDFYGYLPVVKRAVAVAAYRRGAHSYAILKFPKGRSYYDTDTRLWKVDKLAIVLANYENTLLDAIFTSGRVTHKKTEEANVLGLGLGGSTFNNYLAEAAPNFNITMVELEPVMKNVSLDWFDLELNDKHRVVIEDGVQFMAREANQRKQYDIILLDATHSQDGHFTIAPVSVFYEEETLKNMAQLLGQKGALVSNLVFGSRYNIKESSEIIAKKFQKYFRFVEIRRVANTRNNVLIARQLPIDSMNHSIDEYCSCHLINADLC